MNRAVSNAALAAAILALASSVAAQNCYDNPTQCFSFAPEPGEVGRVDSGIGLRSKQLTITGDFRLRLRAAETKANAPYGPTGDNDQQAARARVQLAYQATDKARAFVEFNFAETWAGSDPYSDALTDENYNKVSQAYVAIDDMLGFQDKWRVGRSEYILGNGLILGSCDYLQLPSTFTGAWVSRNFGGHDLEAFVLDDYGPLQTPVDGTRYAGATGKLNLCKEGVVESVSPYYMAGTRDGDTESEDSWVGVDAVGSFPKVVGWNAGWADRMVDGGKDRMAYRAQVHRKFEGFLEQISLTRTDSEGAMHVNPADFASAGLLHQYAGAWRSDLDTWQLGFDMKPCTGVDLNVTLINLDRDGAAAQQGEFEFDIRAGKMLDSGVHLSAAYGRDDDDREVAFFQMTLFF